MAAIRRTAAVALLAALAPLAWPQRTSAKFPEAVEAYLSAVVRANPAQRSALLAGRPATRLLDGNTRSEVAVFGAIWVQAPIARYLEAMRDIETFERGSGFRVTKKIGSPPNLEDFAAMHIPEEDLRDLQYCKVGNCEVKVSEDALQRFRNQVDWKSPNRREAADRVIRQLALEYVNGYLEGGDARLAVYRDTSRGTFVADEFRRMVEEMPEFGGRMANLRRSLLEFPKFQAPNTSSFLYWQEVQFGLKPTIRINHVTIQENASETVIASKMLYASHYFWTALELRALIPDPARGEGFWLLTVNRSRSDGLSGFVGRLIGGRVRSEAEKGTLAALTATKRRLESKGK